jgi:hypothetical protein
MISDGWKKITFLYILLGVTFGAVLCAGIINFIVDPYDLYGNDGFMPIETNQYDAKLDLFSEFVPAPSSLILGNSRVKSFDPMVVGSFTGTRCYNWGLGFASTEIILAELKIALDERNAPIELVLIGIDPIMFNSSVAIPKQARVAYRYTRYFASKPVYTANRERLSTLFSLDQFTMSLAAVMRKWSGREGLVPPEYRADGLTNFAIRHMNDISGPDDLEEILVTGAPKYFNHVLAGWEFIGPERMEAWEELLNLCNEHDIEIYTFMAPLHPLLWELLGEYGSQAIIEETIDYVEGTVAEAGGVFRDYTHLDSWGGNPDMFNDEVHMLPANSADLMHELFTSAGLEPADSGNES